MRRTRSRKAAEENDAPREWAESQHKWKASKTVVDGITFDSAIEAHRWLFLKDREALGEVHSIKRQIKLHCIINGRKLWYLQPDFQYFDVCRGATVVEDTKGATFGGPWQMFQLKRKTIEELYGITIEVVTKGDWQKPYKEKLKRECS